MQRTLLPMVAHELAKCSPPRLSIHNFSWNDMTGRRYLQHFNKTQGKTPIYSSIGAAAAAPPTTGSTVSEMTSTSV